MKFLPTAATGTKKDDREKSDLRRPPEEPGFVAVGPPPGPPKVADHVLPRDTGGWYPRRTGRRPTGATTPTRPRARAASPADLPRSITRDVWPHLRSDYGGCLVVQHISAEPSPGRRGGTLDQRNRHADVARQPGRHRAVRPAGLRPFYAVRPLAARKVTNRANGTIFALRKQHEPTSVAMSRMSARRVDYRCDAAIGVAVC
jgi:hypothetical protein